MKFFSVLIGASEQDIGLGMVVLYGVIGLLIVFLVLAVLIGIVYLMKLAFALFRKSSSKAVAPAETEVLPAQSDAKEEVCADDEIAAVISAVLSAYFCGEKAENKAAPFRVKKIYRLK